MIAPFAQLRRWNWLDNGLLPLLLALLRACWLLPWLELVRRFIVPAETPFLSLPQIVALPVLSLLLTRWLGAKTLVDDRSREGEPWQKRVALPTRLGVAFLGVVAMALVLWLQYYRPTTALWEAGWLVDLGDRIIHPGAAIPPPLVTLLVTAALWMAGLSDAPKRLSHDDIWASFIRGIVAIVLYLLLITLAGQSLSLISGNLILLFFGLGLFALAFSSLKITAGLDRALGSLRGSESSYMGLVNRYWLANVLLVVAVVLGLALLIVFIVAPENLAIVLNTAERVVNLLLNAAGLVIMALAYVLAFIIFYLFQWLEPFIQRLMDRMDDSPLRDTLVALEENMQNNQPEMIVEQTPVPDSYRWIGLAVLVGVIVLAFILALRRMNASAEGEEDEERESIFSSDLLQKQLGGLLDNLLNRLRDAADALNPFLSLEGEEERRRTIRAIYQQLLSRAEALRLMREPAQTPTEYHTRLARRLDADATSLATITAAYHAARYGEEPPSQAQVDNAQRAWAQLEQSLFADEEEKENQEGKQ